MEKNELTELVQGLEAIMGHPERKDLVEPVVQFLVRTETLNFKAVNHLIEAILASESDYKKRIILLNTLSAQDLLEAELMTEELAPWLQKVREALFGKLEAPFVDWQKAREWLESQASNEESLPQDLPLILEKIRQSTDPAGTEVFNAFTFDGMIFPKELSPQVVSLIGNAYRMAEWTGMDPRSLVMHILAGTQLICRRFQVQTGSEDYRLPSGRIVRMHRVIITFPKTIDQDDIIQILRTIKANFGQGKVKKLNRRHHELYELVHRNGGIPNSGRVAFWRGIMTEWNRDHPEKQYRTWKALSIAHMRVTEKLLNPTLGSGELPYEGKVTAWELPDNGIKMDKQQRD